MTLVRPPQLIKVRDFGEASTFAEHATGWMNSRPLFEMKQITIQAGTTATVSTLIERVRGVTILQAVNQVTGLAESCDGCPAWQGTRGSVEISDVGGLVGGVNYTVNLLFLGFPNG